MLVTRGVLLVFNRLFDGAVRGEMNQQGKVAVTKLRFMYHESRLLLFFFFAVLIALIFSSFDAHEILLSGQIICGAPDK